MPPLQLHIIRQLVNTGQQRESDSCYIQSEENLYICVQKTALSIILLAVYMVLCIAVIHNLALLGASYVYLALYFFMK